MATLGKAKAFGNARHSTFPAANQAAGLLLEVVKYLKRLYEGSYAQPSGDK